MYYKDNNDIDILELGTGDMIICAGLLGDLKTGSISVIDNCGKKLPINTAYEFDSMKSDIELNTVLRVTFSQIESVQALIDELQQVKDFMNYPESHPWYDKILNKK